tara:strand:- start:207 stop:1025 length:819 start_codon:yes stop_codon:yes gene_type:complete
MIMKKNILDGGMIFEINKKYSDYGQYAVKNDKNLIEKLYQDYINLGCNYITTCNYCFTPTKLGDWKNLCEKSINIMKKFRKNNVKICGSIPPYFKSYHYEELNDNFCNFYNELVNIFKDKVDYYLIETSTDFRHVEKICEIIRENDKTTNIIVSLYINENNEKNINKYFNLDIHGLFFNCCSFPDLVSFYEKYLRHKNFEGKKFGFLCNKINEKKYAEESDVCQLQNFKSNKNITQEKLNDFLNSLDFEEVFIGGCCGYGVQEMKELIEMLD